MSTYHVVRDELQVPAIDINLVHIEDSAHLAQDRSASGFHTVGRQDGVDVIRLDGVFIYQALLIATSELPDARDI